MPETNKLNPQYNYPPSQPERSSKTGLIITVVIIVLVAAGAIVYFTKHKTPPKQSPQTTNKPAATGGPTNPYTLSNSPADGFPKELLPAKILGSPQYWSSAQGIGATVVVKASVVDEAKSFLSSLPSSWQVSSKQVSSSHAAFNLFNKDSGKSMAVDMSPFPAGSGTTLTFTLAK